jgi:lysophospholipase L1-like esterase
MRLAYVIFLLAVGTETFAASGEHWVTTWANPQPTIPTRFPPLPAASPAGKPRSGPNALTLVIDAKGFHDQTVRMVVHTSIGGRRLRIRLSNPYGALPVKIGAARIALRSEGSATVPGTDRAVLFNGKTSCTLGPGVILLSDPIDMGVGPQTDLAVSLYFPGDTGPPAARNGLHTTYISRSGDATAASKIDDGLTTPIWYWLTAVDVLAPADTAAIIAFGDSITEGWRSTDDANRSYPADLSRRLVQTSSAPPIAVANLGLGGNRVLHDGTGASALARFDRDVLGQAGVTWLLLLEGVNDVGHIDQEPVTADDVIGGLKQIIERAHTQGIKVMVGTLTPYAGAAYASAAGEAIRQSVNAWIRTTNLVDATVDFDAATRDPADATRLRPEFDPGDHLHPNDAGYAAMADAIELRVFRNPVRSKQHQNSGRKGQRKHEVLE